MSNASATLTVWASAWLAGAAAPDDALDALTAWAPVQRVHAADPETAAQTGLPGPGAGTVGAAALFTTLRRSTAGGRAGSGAEVRLVLPVAGDVRGLPAGTSFARAALAAGEGVLVPDAGLGLVPAAEGEEALRWVVHSLPVDVPPAEHVGLAEAEHALRSAVRDSARALDELQVAREDATVRQRIAAALRATPQPEWPRGVPPRALRVLDQAQHVGAILEAAAQDTPGGAWSAAAADAREQLLRPLWTDVRTAQLAAVAESVRVLAAHPSQR
ncbi:hypothetical protein [Rhodococcus sp. X156]|uniref:hypothetical protein n=1 Tax=Rhodococcus sp. X156 TaxID=2499145 RepID=UPI000FDBA222|nr:hypothetical protein [Rhodococcus sp. X156]